MQDNDKYQVLATKVSPLAYDRINRLARKKGMSVYDLVQMVIDTLIRYMDDRHNLTPDMEQAMSIFEHMVGWRDALNLADPTGERVIGEAIYFLYDPEGKRRGCRGIMVHKPFFGEWSQTANIQDIFERCLMLLMPRRYQRMMELAREYDINSVVELIDHLLDLHAHEADIAAMRAEFEDANRDEWGRDHNADHYKTHQARTLDMFEEAERRKQEEEDKEKERRSEEARQWLEDNMDFKPFCCEW